MQEVTLKMSAAGLEKLQGAIERFRRGADHLEAAHALLLELRESGELTVAGDVVSGEANLEPAAAAVVD